MVDLFFRPHDIENTIKDGIPAHGHGFFSINKARGLWSLGYLLVSGLDQCYVGDYCMGTVCCLTLGFCCVGRTLSCFVLNEKIKHLNNTIKESVMKKYTTYTVEVVRAKGQPRPHRHKHESTSEKPEEGSTNDY